MSACVCLSSIAPRREQEAASGVLADDGIHAACGAHVLQNGAGKEGGRRKEGWGGIGTYYGETGTVVVVAASLHHPEETELPLSPVSHGANEAAAVVVAPGGLRACACVYSSRLSSVRRHCAKDTLPSSTAAVAASCYYVLFQEGPSIPQGGFARLHRGTEGGRGSSYGDRVLRPCLCLCALRSSAVRREGAAPARPPSLPLPSSVSFFLPPARPRGKIGVGGGGEPGGLTAIIHVMLRHYYTSTALLLKVFPFPQATRETERQKARSNLVSFSLASSSSSSLCVSRGRRGRRRTGTRSPSSKPIKQFHLLPGNAPPAPLFPQSFFFFFLSVEYGGCPLHSTLHLKGASCHLRVVEPSVRHSAPSLEAGMALCFHCECASAAIRP